MPLEFFLPALPCPVPRSRGLRRQSDDVLRAAADKRLDIFYRRFHNASNGFARNARKETDLSAAFILYGWACVSG